MDLLRYDDRDALFAGVAQAIADDLAAAIAKNGRAVAALAGGTTPAPAFDILGAMDPGWDRVTLMPSDERWVDAGDDRSNFRLLRQHFATTRAKCVPLLDGGDDPEQAAMATSARLQPLLPLDLCLLGMGADMHTASLFPHARGTKAALQDDAAPVLPVWPDNVPEARLTLTAPALAQATRVHILIAGTEKMDTLERARAPGPVMDAPVRVILDRARVHWAA